MPYNPENDQTGDRVERTLSFLVDATDAIESGELFDTKEHSPLPSRPPTTYMGRPDVWFDSESGFTEF